MKTETINKIFQTFNNANTNPQIELDYTNNYTLLIAVVLSARTTDKQVNKATESLFKVVKTPQDMIKLGEEKLMKYIKSIGLYKTKAKNVIALSKLLIEKHNSKTPSKFEELTALPGVGSKTAKVVLNAAFDQPFIAVDTHVLRVSQRIGLTNKQSVQKVEEDLEKVIPSKWKLKAHYWLVLHGRYMCKALKPKCNDCIISKYCKYFKDNN